MRSFKLAVISAVIALVAAPAAFAQAQTATIKIAGTSTGKTVKAFGYNIHTERASHWTWLRHGEGNAARVWLDGDIRYQSDDAPWPRIPSRAQFVARRLDTRNEINNGRLGNTSAANCGATLAANTTSAYIDWAYYVGAWDVGRSSALFDELKRDGMEPVIERDLLMGSFGLASDESDPNYWQDRWKLWRWAFANAYIAASRWDVTTWQFYNEPNHGDDPCPGSLGCYLPKAQFLERNQLASDAVQLAIKTVNKRRTYCGGKILTANVLAPTSYAGPGIYATSTTDNAWRSNSTPPPPFPPPAAPTGYTGGDLFCTPWHDEATELDDSNCYGRYALRHRAVDNFYGYTLTTAEAFSTTFQSYSFQDYGWASNNADKMRRRIQDLWTYLKAFPAPVMDVFLTETNIHNKSAYPATATADSGAEFSRLAGMLISIAGANTSGSEPAKNVYVATLMQTPDDDGPGPHIGDKKGAHFVGDSNHIGGVSNVGEVVRLFAKGLAGGRPRYDATVTGPSATSVMAVGAEDTAHDMFYLMVSNTGSSSVTASIDLSAIQPSIYAEVDSVTTTQRGNAYLAAITTDTFSYALPAYSVFLFGFPTVNTTTTVVSAAGDSTVKGGSNSYLNFGGSDSLYAAGDANYPQGRSVAYLRFPIPTSIDLSSVKFAILEVYGQAKTPGGTVGTRSIAHVYGLDDDSWTESGIKGSNAPNLAFTTGTTTRIEDNFVTSYEAGPESPQRRAEFLGHLTGAASAGFIGVDVTRWLKLQGDRQASFMVTREIRFDPQDVTNFTEDTLTESNRSLWMASRQNANADRRPKLIILK